MKKSLTEALDKAQAHSVKFPENIVYVLDKPLKRAVISSCEWTHKELVREGWHTVAKYKGGVQIG